MAISGALVTPISVLDLDNTANSIIADARAKRLVKPTSKVPFPGPTPKISHNRRLATRSRWGDRRLRPSAFERSSGSAEREAVFPAPDTEPTAAR
jgi:hypothetical protein